MSDSHHKAAKLLEVARTATLTGASAGAPGEWQPPSPAELQGLVPNVEVESLIGKGGMGAVYRANQPHLGRTVALKVLRPELARDAAFAARFSRESRAMARLSHPHIVTLYDSGVSGGQAWMIMEFIAGATLRTVLAEGRLSPQEAMRLVPQICSGLQYAHDQGVVHRDLKPENILIDERGQAHLADFGLAKVEDGEILQDITQPGQVLGTLHYIAPEQLAGDAAANHRVDIYALGVLIYEMLTGSLPMGRFEPPSRRIAIDMRMDEVVLRSLERDPERRWQRVDEMAQVMEGIGAKPAPLASAAPAVQDSHVSTSPCVDLPPVSSAAPRSRLARVGAWLRRFTRVAEGSWLAGICAGLERHTTVPAWCWRLFLILCMLGFYVSKHVAGWVVIAYLMLWIVLPKAQVTPIIAKRRAEREPLPPCHEAKSHRKVLPLVILAFFFGIFGAHRFYSGRSRLGCFQLFTFGGLGVWAMADFILAICGELKDDKGLKIRDWT